MVRPPAVSLLSATWPREVGRRRVRANRPGEQTLIQSWQSCKSARLKRLNESAALSSFLSTRGVLGGVVRTGRDSADTFPPSQSGAPLLCGTAVDGVKRWVLATHARVLSYLGPKRATQHITITVRIFEVVPRRHARCMCGHAESVTPMPQPCVCSLHVANPFTPNICA